MRASSEATAASGVSLFDLSGDAIIELLESPLPDGLPPMSLAPLPLPGFQLVVTSAGEARRMLAVLRCRPRL